MISEHFPAFFYKNPYPIPQLHEKFKTESE